MPRHAATLKRYLPVSFALLAMLTAGAAAADPIPVRGDVNISSAGGDFPDYHGPINELIYFLEGPGLPGARGESLETIPQLGNRGGLLLSREPTPQPLQAGQSVSLSTTATFKFGRAFESGWPDPPARVYDFTGEFQFTGGTGVLAEEPAELLSASAPVTFRGTLNALDIDTGALLFRRELRGQGTGRVIFAPANPSFFDYRYTLTPVPEPGTILLFGGGLSLVLATLRRRTSSSAT
jgi:hypothetical protein